jgi:hypothetical protein
MHVHAIVLTAFAFAVPAAAQTTTAASQPATLTEKLWRIESSGLGG